MNPNTGRTLAVRLDSDGDVLLTGPALRALAATGSRVDLLVSPAGAAAGRLLPDVDDVLVFAAPWTGFDPPPVDAAGVADLVDRLRARHYDRAVVFTSFHQSPLPMALLLRLAGIGWIAADSIDYPGSLLDLRHHRRTGDSPEAGVDGAGAGGGHDIVEAAEGDRHEVLAALDLARAAGAPATTGTNLSVRRPLPDVSALIASATAAGVPGSYGDRGYVVVHPGASVPARAPRAVDAAGIVRALRAADWPVVVTGGPGETALTAAVAGVDGLDLGGRTDLAQLAAVLDGAACVVVGNTGPAHLAAAVRTPVVSLFAPVVPAARWAPWGVPTILLGDQSARCRDSRARHCPLAGHPCLASIDPAEVVAAVATLAGVGEHLVGVG
jgi:heptosyltransferase-3